MEGLTPAERVIAAGNSRRAPVALSLLLLSRFLKSDDGPVPFLDTVRACAAPSSVSEEEGCAAVDRWARQHSVHAGWKGRTYEASVSFGPLAFIVFWLRPDPEPVPLPAPAVREDETEMAVA
jgi:hypothetical protein